jgi:hypothetical protein
MPEMGGPLVVRLIERLVLVPQNNVNWYTEEVPRAFEARIRLVLVRTAGITG